MVVVTFVDIKHSNDKLVFVMDEFLQKLDIVRISEVIPCQHINLVHQVLLSLR